MCCFAIKKKKKEKEKAPFHFSPLDPFFFNTLIFFPH